MEIKASCKFNLESMKAFTHLLLFKKANPKKRMIFWLIAYLFFSAVIIAEIILLDADTVLFVLLAFIFLWFLLGCYFYFLLPKKQYKALGKMKEIVNEYVFGDEVIGLNSIGDGYNGDGEIEYDLIYKVMETSKYIFIFLNKTQTYIVNKSTITGGTVEELKNKLSSYVGDNYITCKY